MRSSEMRLAVSCCSEWPAQTSPAWASWAATTGAACRCGSGSNSALLSSCYRSLTPLSMLLRPSSPVQEEIIQRVQEAVKDGRVESVVMTVRAPCFAAGLQPPPLPLPLAQQVHTHFLDCVRACCAARLLQLGYFARPVPPSPSLTLACSLPWHSHAAGGHAAARGAGGGGLRLLPAGCGELGGHRVRAAHPCGGGWRHGHGRLSCSCCSCAYFSFFSLKPDDPTAFRVNLVERLPPPLPFLACTLSYSLDTSSLYLIHNCRMTAGIMGRVWRGQMHAPPAAAASGATHGRLVNWPLTATLC